MVFQKLRAKLEESVELLACVAGPAKEEISMIELLRSKAKLRKSRFAWSAKDCIEKAIKDLDEWHRMFDPSWYMMRNIENKLIDDQLAKFKAPITSPLSVLQSMRDDKQNGLHSAGLNVFISEDFATQKSPLQYSPAQLGRETATSSSVIVDTMICRPEIDTSTVIKDVRDLARKLTKTDPHSHNLLGCRGVVKYAATYDKDEVGSEARALTFEFVFAIPKALSSPRSLRDILLTSTKPPILDEKIELARQLANSVASVHNANFVHKNIRPETILVFEEEGCKSKAAFLVGFEAFRMADERTYSYRDSSWENNLYRHPLGQGLLPNEYYSMQHDIYTLGVCLLEIGLWKSFLPIEGRTTTSQANEAIDFSGALAVKGDLERAFCAQKILLDTARDQLPITMGTKYGDVVVSCLTCLDKDDHGLGYEILDPDGVVIGVSYIERVLQELQQIAV